MPSLTKVQTGFIEPQGAFPIDTGTASAPGLKFEDHAGTGIFSPSTGEFAISTGNTQQALTIHANGNVGIGTNNATQKLDIVGNIRSYSQSVGSPPTIYMNYDVTPAQGAAHGRITVSNSTQNYYAGKIHLQPQYWNGSAYDYLENGLVVDATGNVGIGTNTATYNLEVSASEASITVAATAPTASGAAGSGYFRIRDNTNNFDVGAIRGLSYTPANDGSLLFYTADNGALGERVRITETGNVGIGTNDPQEKLDVWGQFTVTAQDGGINFSDPDTKTEHHMLYMASSDNSLKLKTYNGVDGWVERVTVLNTGNVGIGASNPSSNLHVHRDTKDHSILRLHSYLQTTSGSAYQNYQEIQFSATGDITGQAGIRHHANIWSDGNSALSFWTNTHGGSYAERVRINGSGNVGIGTNNPLQKLHTIGSTRSDADSSNFMCHNSSGGWRGDLQVDGDGFGLTARYNNNGFISFKTITGGTLYERLRLNNSGSVHVTGSYLTTSQALADQGIVFKSNTTISSSEVYPGISWTGNPNAVGRARAGITAIATSDNNASDILFLARYASDATELNVTTDTKMRITSGGNVGIGTNPTTTLDVYGGGGLLVKRSSGTSVARFGNTATASPNITVFGSTTVNEPFLGCDGDTLTLGTSNYERVRIDSAGRFGLNHSLSGAAAYNRLVVNSPDASCWMSLQSSNTGSTINSDGLDIGLNQNNQGHIWLRENADLLVATNNSERFRISSSGVVYTNYSVRSQNQYSSNGYGGATSGWWNDTYQSDNVRQIRGYVSGPDGWPSCTTPAKYVTVGQLVNGGGYNSFIHVQIYGSHRGIASTNYIEHNEWLIQHADHMTFQQLNTGPNTYNSKRVDPWNPYTSTAGVFGQNLSTAGYPFDITFRFSPQCGAGLGYTYIVTWYHGSFVPHSSRSW